MDDKNDSSRSEGVDGDVVLPKIFKSLKCAINSKIFRRAISVAVKTTGVEVIIMILKFLLVYALLLTAITDLFIMLNSIFAESSLPNTNNKYLIDELFYAQNCTQLYRICPKRGAFLGIFYWENTFLKCKICKTKINVKYYAYKEFLS